MKVKGIGSWSMLEEYVMDNCYARFHTAAVKYSLVLDLT